MDSKDPEIRIGILTVSDRCYSGITRDTSGEYLEGAINEKNIIPGGKVVVRMCVPDQFDQIEAILLRWSDIEHLNLIITTGGSGLSDRDITPEVTKSLIDKDAFGITAAILHHSVQTTPFAMLGRPVCGIRKRTLIINFPGSSNACAECLDIIKIVIPHAVHIIGNNKEKIQLVHGESAIIKNIDGLHIHRSESEKLGCNTNKAVMPQVASRSRTSPYPMISVHEALTLILQTITTKRSDKVNLRQSLGYVLYSDVWCKDPLPPFPASIKDGYAVLSADGKGLRKVVYNSVAGTKPSECVTIKSGECARISTGAPVPPGADAVVQVEDTTLVSAAEANDEEYEIGIRVSPCFGQDIRPVGSDLKEGSLVLAAGTYLTSSELGTLATVGISEVPVVKKPTICVYSTGNELQSPEEVLEEGKIRDSNRTSILAILEENGYSGIDGGIIKDDSTVVTETLKKGLLEADVIITTGSASMGELDILTNVLIENFGAVIHFGRVNMKPGKPTKFATAVYEGEKKYFFILPGNPVSAIVTCHLFVIPALRALSGIENSLPTIIKAKLSSDVTLDERCEFQRARLQWKSNSPIPVAVTTGNQISSRIVSMLQANCLLHLPPRTPATRYLQAGELVNAQIIGRI